MGLLDELRQEQSPPKHLCGVAKVLTHMDKKQSADLLAALADPTIMATNISRVLARHGFDVKPDALRRHRKGECLCE